MKKQEVIDKVYGNYADIAKGLRDENGWIPIGSYYTYFPQNKERSECGWLERPKSLQGIENNNGWIKIESEESLPKEYDFYNACYFSEKFPKDVPMFYGCNLPDLRNYFNEELITHYRPIVKHDYPIF